MAKQRFYVIVRDDDKRSFSIEGPMADDTDWTSAVIREQTKGRHFRCFIVPATSDAEQLKISYATQERLVNVPSGSILMPTIDLD